MITFFNIGKQSRRQKLLSYIIKIANRYRYEYVGETLGSL
jgi:hypothetical protein